MRTRLRLGLITPVPLALSLLLSSVTAEARWLKKSEVGSVVEVFNIDVEAKANGAGEQTIEYGLRIQAEDAKANASKFNIDYNASTDVVEVIEAYTLNGKIKIPVDPTAIEDRDAGESKDYDPMKIRSIVFPQVQIGSRLFVRYRTRTAKALVKDRWSEHFALYPTSAMERIRYRVHSERPLFIESSDPGKYMNIRQKDPNHVEVTLKRELPGGVQAEKEPYWHPSRAAELWLSTEREWAGFFGGLNEDFQKIVNAPIPPKLEAWLNEAKRLKDPEAQVFFLMRKMSEELRYFGDWRRHDGGLIPRTLVEIERSRYGDCKDLASLLAALLRQLGFHADPSLIRRGDNPYGHEPDFKLPATSRFNHVITRVERPDGRTWWLDATNPVASLDALADVSGRPTLVLEAKAPRLDRTPDALAAQHTQEIEYVYRFPKVDEVEVKVSAQFKGLGAARLANSLMLSPRAQVLSDVLDYFSESEEVKRHRFVSEPTTTRRLADVGVKLEFTAPTVTYSAGPDAFFVMPDSFLNGPFYETLDRESDLKLNEMPYVTHVVRKLERRKLAQAPPPPCVIDSTWFRAERRVGATGHDVIIDQVVELKRAYLTNAELRSPEFARAQAAARACFSRAGVLIAPQP